MSILLPVSVLCVSSGGTGFSESGALLWFAEIQHRVRPEKMHHRQSESSRQDGQRRSLHLQTGERIWHRYRHTTEETYFCWPYYNKAANNVKHVYANAPTYKHFIAPPDKKMHEEWVHRLLDWSNKQKDLDELLDDHPERHCPSDNSWLSFCSVCRFRRTLQRTAALHCHHQSTSPRPTGSYTWRDNWQSGRRSVACCE